MSGEPQRAAYWRAIVVLNNPSVLGSTDHDATLATLMAQLEAVINSSDYGGAWDLTSVEIEPALGPGDWVRAYAEDAVTIVYARVIDNDGTLVVEYGDGSVGALDRVTERL